MIVYWFCGFKSHRAPSFFKKGFLIQTSIQTLISFTKTNKRESQENKLRERHHASLLCLQIISAVLFLQLFIKN